MSRIEEILAELPHSSDTRSYCAELDGWPLDQLEAMGHALVGLPESAQHWAVDSVLEHVLGLLAGTRSAGHAAAVARIATGGGLPVATIRWVAPRLASSQRQHVLVSLLAGLPDDEWGLGTELGACLLHEMILRRKSVEPVVDTWTRRLAGHPLADLPLYPLPGETRVLSRYRGQPSDPPFAPGVKDPLTLAGTVPSVTRDAAPPDLTAAVTTWLTESNGVAEAAVFRLAPPPAPEDVGVRTLEALGLDCLAGGGLALRHSTLDEVVAVLFGAAASGGAYDHGLGGAYGRAATWRSVNALAGGSHVGCTWWIFDAANDWFERVFWDLGVVCLRPGGHVMAVLAATDTD